MKTFAYYLTAIIALDIIAALLIAWFKSKKESAKPVGGIKHAQATGKEHYTNFSTYTILTAVFIGATTLLSLSFFSLIHDIITSQIKPFSTEWKPKDSITLRSGPEWFYYDQKKGTVNSLQAITEKDKSSLTELLSKDSKSYPSYSQAIDALSYFSNQDGGNSGYCWILLLYCVTGVIGVQLRTINNFVGNACFKKKFDFGVWWPWYLLRPLIGFITGGVVFLLIDGKLFYSTQIVGGLSAAVLALAFIGGFSADDFYDMLRRISKRIFSTTTQPENEDKKKQKVNAEEKAV